MTNEEFAYHKSMAFIEWIVRRDDLVPRLKDDKVCWYLVEDDRVIETDTDMIYSLFNNNSTKEFQSL
ncbi:MAG: hypothetical protein V4538_15000 [Bacteroidota bacterium]